MYDITFTADSRVHDCITSALQFQIDDLSITIRSSFAILASKGNTNELRKQYIESIAYFERRKTQYTETLKDFIAAQDERTTTV